MKIKKALVTGGTSGIGFAICEQLLASGSEVYSLSRNPHKCESRENFHPLKLDLSDLTAVSEFGESFIKEHGIPDLLINNAGYGVFYEWSKFPYDEIEKQINVLFSSPVLLCKSFAPKMEKMGGVVVNISSLAVLYPLPFMPLYNAGKSALSSFTQSMMLESSRSVRWIDFRLGDICTGFNQSAPQQDYKLQDGSMRNAWVQIEKQLQASPNAVLAATQIIQSVERNRNGIVYGGGFFQSRIAPFLRLFLGSFTLKKVLSFRYGLNK